MGKNVFVVFLLKTRRWYHDMHSAGCANYLPRWRCSRASTNKNPLVMMSVKQRTNKYILMIFPIDFSYFLAFPRALGLIISSQLAIVAFYWALIFINCICYEFTCKRLKYSLAENEQLHTKTRSQLKKWRENSGRRTWFWTEIRSCESQIKKMN